MNRKTSFTWLADILERPDVWKNFWGSKVSGSEEQRMGYSGAHWTASCVWAKMLKTWVIKNMSITEPQGCSAQKKINLFKGKEGCDWFKILKQPSLDGFGYRLLPPPPASLSTWFAPLSSAPLCFPCPFYSCVSKTPASLVSGRENAIVGVK